jgi:hypothetical protein
MITDGELQRMLNISTDIQAIKDNAVTVSVDIQTLVQELRSMYEWQKLVLNHLQKIGVTFIECE